MRTWVAIGIIVVACIAIWHAPTSGNPDERTIAGIDADTIAFSALFATAVLVSTLIGTWRALLVVPLSFLAMYALLDAIDIYILDEFYETPTLLKLLYVAPPVLTMFTALAVLGVMIAKGFDSLRSNRHRLTGS
jgi:hypothetical protein